MARAGAESDGGIEMTSEDILKADGAARKAIDQVAVDNSQATVERGPKCIAIMQYPYICIGGQSMKRRTRHQDGGDSEAQECSIV